ncbi:non-ribosomal peptide synthetase [Pseudoalteromonas luteoviolacea]|uniref:Amino acid adenylation domain protein n=1 Tax=Pseudoalteromonas luteoviolacea (strain 2ta16) TaxID=1353533 RepID=V4I140_PSEL2|nr:non-ribosomal peptide synthetase [Pseudoalteromonas luteoviolacea]ESP93944.1 amino acid adenylation domain protein [Pseudoalteromonas luteoviolacea 2ta16]KZN31375.1 hypothetical protein N483_06010 [Pseudoalteromonas luteoviolacea NCIMB 1944]
MNNMTVSLLSELKSLGIQLTQEQGKLKLKAPEGALTAALKEKILKHKGDIIALLKLQQEGFTKLDKIPKRTSNSVLPLSNAQRKLWLIDMLEGTSIHYNMPGTLRFEGALNESALFRAIETIIQRHEALRTVIKVDEFGKPHQCIYDSFEFSLPLVDLTALTPQQQYDAVVEHYVEDINTAFDLSKDLMFRAQLLKLSAQSHVLIFDIHHISADGWSFEIFYKELGLLYLAYSSGKANPLPALPIQFADYTLWMESKFENKELDKQLTYWQAHLADIPAVHKLPLDKERPEVQTLNGKKYSRKFSEQSYAALKQFAERNNVSLFIVLQSAYAAVLSRWSGEKDIVMATPNANRARPELAELIGFFTNTLILRTECDLGQSFNQFLQSSTEVLHKAFENQLVPFDMLVEALNPPRVMAHNALVQITFSLESQRTGPADVLSSSTLKVTSAIDEDNAPTEVPSKFDLEFYIWELENGCKFEWTYNCDLFEEATIKALDRDFESCLHGILNNPDLPMHQFFSLDNQQQQLITQSNALHLACPNNETLFDMLERQCEQTPNNIAVKYGELSLSYCQLHEKANQLAHCLRTSQDVQPGQIVGLYAERSLDMIIGMLAIVKAGGCYLPLDPSLPKQRLDFMLADAQVSLVLAQTHLCHSLASSTITVQQIATEQSWPSTTLLNRASPELPVYAIYTSGSTGRPKGVLNHNKGLCHKLHGIQHQYSLQAGERMLQKTPVHFDVSIFEIFWPLTTGATMVLAEPEAHKDPQRIYQLICSEQINVVHFVPAMLRLFLEEIKSQELAGLRLLFTSGEELSYALQAQAITELKGVELVNLYGPTEAAIHVTGWRFNELRADKKVPIGFAMPNVQIHVLDPWQQPVPIGVSGELYIGGPQVGMCYLNNESLTAERFPTLVINGHPTRVYRTGDRARRLKDGAIEFLGRFDEQVKLRGFRIELGEIEFALMNIGEVESAAVAIKELEKGVASSALLVAYVKMRDGNITDVDIKEELSKFLPDYMIPAAIVRMTELPLTPSGKLNRLALPAPGFAPSTADIIQPNSDTEKTVLRIFSELLNRESICITADFFSLGGHSLLASELRMKLQKSMNMDVPLRVIFEKPTVKALSVWCENATNNTISSIEAVPEAQWVPSFAQRSLWFISQIEGGSKYNIHDSFLMTGQLDIPALTQAFIALVERHSVFRQVFPTVNGQPKLTLLNSYSPLTVTSLAHLHGGEQLEALEKLSTEHVLYPFDISAQGLFKAQLVELGEQRYRLMLTLHHMVVDGQSFPVLMRDLISLYSAQCGNKATLPAMSIQYGDFAVWQKAHADSGAIEQQKAYWLKKLKGAPELLSLPSDYPRPSEVSYRGETLALAFPDALISPLERFSRKNDSTLFMTLLTIYKALLSMYSDETDICVGTAVNNRSHHQLKDVIGMFVNRLVLRSKVSLDESLSEALVKVRKTTLDAFSHQDLPFSQLVTELNPKRNLNYNALFQVAFQFEQSSMSYMQNHSVDLEGLSIEKEQVADNISKYDLSLYVVESFGKLECNWEYSSDLFKRERIERMHDQFCNLLEAALDNPNEPLADLLMGEYGAGVFTI